MKLSQSVEGCLESAIGGAGLPQAALDKNLAKLEPRLASLREAYTKRTLPLLRVAERRDDIASARDAFQRLAKGARTLVFFGTGGSSLGGQTLAQLGGWAIPGDDKHGSEERPRTRFYDYEAKYTADRNYELLTRLYTAAISRRRELPEPRHVLAPGVR